MSVSARELSSGGSIARFSGENVHKRLISEDAYKSKQWDDALKNAFLGTDEDIRAGMSFQLRLTSISLFFSFYLYDGVSSLDTRFFRDPSGCTAVAALVTHDGRIFVVSITSSGTQKVQETSYLF